MEKENMFAVFMEASTEAIMTDEIVDEASGLLATIGEGVDLETITRELFNYSQAVTAMTLTKILHTLYSPKHIDEMMNEYTDSLSKDLVSDISLFLEKEGN